MFTSVPAYQDKLLLSYQVLPIVPSPVNRAVQARCREVQGGRSPLWAQRPHFFRIPTTRLALPSVYGPGSLPLAALGGKCIKK
jgi:hypothetical protein